MNNSNNLNTFTFKTAERKRAKLRLAMSGPSGSGKTYSALLIASGIAPWQKIAVIDTEHSSSELYANLGNYSVLTLTPPYDPLRYVEAIKAAELAGFEVLIIDSLSHAWAGEGGILDQQGKATDTKYRGNSFSAWREFTPKHNALVEAMLNANMHIIATTRSKTEYSLVDENGKKLVKKLGLAPVQRDGLEYEFTVAMELSADHTAIASKDRTSIFDGKYFKPSKQVGERLLHWLNNNGNVIPAESYSANLAEVIPANIPLPPDDNTLADEFRVLNCELKASQSGRRIIRLSLMGRTDNITAWSDDLELLQLKTGAKIEANLSKKNNAWMLDTYRGVGALEAGLAA
ncbi:MAG: ATP-binding protein [Negativicutes bacterium]